MEIRWKKTGGGSFRMRSGKIIKPGQIFTATEDEIPVAFRNVIIPLDTLPNQEQVVEEDVPIKVVATEYKVIPRGKSKTWFDVVNAQGKVLNEKALHEEDAKKLVTAIQ